MVTVIRVTPAEAAALAAAKSPSKNNGNTNKNGKGKKRALSSLSGGKENSKRQRAADRVNVDLSDIPPQLPIPKSGGHMKEGSSKYAGVSFDKKINKWKARVMIDGKAQHIGYYKNEEDAAADYARAVVKYKGQDALDKARERKSGSAIDLSDVPPQQPIPKIKERIKEGSSKYTGVSFNKTINKWQTAITIEGKTRYLGCYENEEEAAADYARAVFKYKGQVELDKARERKRAVFKYKGEQALDKEKSESTGSRLLIDLNDVPPQLPIPKSGGWMKEGGSKYAGVTFHKAKNKWQAQIWIEGKSRLIGHYENEEEAAVDYARTVFKYHGQEALDKARARGRNISEHSINNLDLSDVPPKQPILKSSGRMKEGASRYTGVHLDKASNKWHAKINIEGKSQYLGSYENEEEAAIDYARAVFKYKGGKDKAREKRKVSLPAIDLSDVPPQQPILKSADQVKEGSSRYAGVYFNKSRNIWTSTIRIDGNLRHIGYYKSEEQAAIDYARAAFKYQKQCHNL